MATVEEALRSKLVGTAAVTALVGQRVYPLVLPDGQALPAVVYQRVTTARGASHTATVGRGLVNATMQFACIGLTYGSARAVATAVRQALEWLRETISGVDVDAIHFGDEEDGYSEPGDKTAASFTVFVDATVWYCE